MNITKLRSYARSLLLISLVILFVLLFFRFSHKTSDSPKAVVKNFQNKIVDKTSLNVSIGLPVRLIIPIINIDADIQYVGVTHKGEMEVPSNTADVGWFELGSRPGNKGSAVMTGHLNGENNNKGVFIDLGKLKIGDKLYVKDDKGVTIPFIVMGSRIYKPGYADGVFSSKEGVHLNLITCDGAWDEVRKSYSKRLVIFSDMLPIE